MFCNKCGTQVPDGQAFCPNCGNALGSVPAPRPTVNIDLKKLLPWIGIVLIGLITFFSFFKMEAIVTKAGNNTNTDLRYLGAASSLLIFNAVTLACLLGTVFGIVKNRAFALLGGAVAAFVGFVMMFQTLLQLGESNVKQDNYSVTVGFSVLGWFVFIFQAALVAVCVIELVPALKEKK